MDSAFTYALERVVKKCTYQWDLLRWNGLPLLKRIFTRPPVDPDPSKSLYSLTVEVNKLFGEHYSKDRACCVYLDTQRKTFLPILFFKGWYNGCCFMSRRAFDRNGSFVEWGCCAPYDECGLSGLPSEHGIHDAKELEIFFESQTKEIGRVLRTLFFSSLNDNI